MSKFFNETLKAGYAVQRDEALALDGLPESAEASSESFLEQAGSNSARTGIGTASGDHLGNGIPGLSEGDLSLQGLASDRSEARVAIADPLEPTATNSDSVQLPTERDRRVEIPQSKLLVGRFKGSKSLQLAEESYRTLRTRLLCLRSSRPLRSLIVTSSTPGEGKTLTSLSLALSCSQMQDLRVLLIDGDIRTAGLSRLLELDSMPGLANVLSAECSGESVVLETNRPNLHVCSAGSTTLPSAELYAGPLWQKFITWCSKSFDFVIVDSPPVFTLADVELMTAACDGVLLVVRARRTHREMLRKSASQIDAKKLLGVIYNGSEGSSHDYYYAGPKER